MRDRFHYDANGRLRGRSSDRGPGGGCGIVIAIAGLMLVFTTGGRNAVEAFGFLMLVLIAVVALAISMRLIK